MTAPEKPSKTLRQRIDVLVVSLLVAAGIGLGIAVIFAVAAVLALPHVLLWICGRRGFFARTDIGTGFWFNFHKPFGRRD